MSDPAAPEEARTEPAAAFAFEASVAIALAAAAFLWRENPALQVPQVYWSLGALLVVTLAAGVSLRLGAAGPGLAAAATVAECSAITAVVAYSGGKDSALWVLYLMPVYSACLLLDARATAWVVAGTASFDASFQVLWAERVGPETWFSVCVQAGVLSAGGWALWRLASRHRRALAALDGERRLMAGLVARMDHQRGDLEESRRVAEVGLLSGGIVHDLRTPLSVIQGFAGLLARPGRVPEDALADLARIQTSVRNCLDVLTRFSEFSRGRDIALAPCALAPLLEAARARAGERGARLEFSAPPAGLPPVLASPPHLERALGVVLEAAAGLVPSGSRLTLEVGAPEVDGRVLWLEVRLGLPVPVAAAAAGLAALGTSRQAAGTAARGDLALAREVVLKHDGGISLREAGPAACLLTVSLAAAPRPDGSK
ncbi:HAMP domain-containing histidine kinase [bacterium]|nr:MAG: HAMP domain-containing histidine kinase [bacterium]